jgi:hypothetical protein
VEAAAELLLPNTSFIEFYTCPLKGGLVHESFFLSGSPTNSNPLELILIREEDNQNTVASSQHSTTSKAIVEPEERNENTRQSTLIPSPTSDDKIRDKSVNESEADTAADMNEDRVNEDEEVIDASQQATTAVIVLERVHGEEEGENKNVGIAGGSHAMPTGEFMARKPVNTVKRNEEIDDEQDAMEVSTENSVEDASAHSEGGKPTYDWQKLAELFDRGKMSPLRSALAEADDDDFEKILAIGGQLLNVAKNAYIYGREKENRDFTEESLRLANLPLRREKVAMKRVKGKQTGAENIHKKTTFVYSKQYIY